MSVVTFQHLILRIQNQSHVMVAWSRSCAPNLVILTSVVFDLSHSIYQRRTHIVTYIHTYIHTYRQTDRQPVTLCAWLRVCSNICQLQRVSINPPPLVRPLYYLNNSVKNQPILIIFGIWHPEKTWHRKNINVPTSSTNSWRECKTVIFQLFSTMISNKQHHHSKTVKMTLY